MASRLAMILEVRPLENPDDALCRRRQRLPRQPECRWASLRSRAARGARQTTLARRPGMRSWTAMQSVTRRERPRSQATTPVRGIVRTGGRSTQADRIPTWDGFPGREMPHRTPQQPSFPLVSACVEPPAAIEPATPSLPWNHREPLCGPPFPQVRPDRKGRSYRFSSGEVMRSLSWLKLVMPIYSARRPDWRSQHPRRFQRGVRVHE